MINYSDLIDEFFEDYEISKKKFKLIIDFYNDSLLYEGKDIILDEPMIKKEDSKMKEVSIKTINRKKNKNDIF